MSNTKELSNVNKINPLVSVIIPIFKVESYLIRCLYSVQNQTYKNIEIILIDDGSPDECPFICDNFALHDNRFIVLHQKNMGLGEARNSGIKISKGEWICFIDSDDWVDENYVEVLLSAAINSNCLMSVCKMRNVLSNTRSKVCKTQEEQLQLMDWRSFLIFAMTENKALFDGYYMQNSANAKMYHRRLMENNRFSNLKLSEDLASIHLFFYSCGINNSKIAISVLCTYNYFQRVGSKVFSVKSPDWLSVLKAYDIALNFYESKGEAELYDLTWRSYFNWCMILVCEFYRDIPNHKDVIENVLKRIKHGMSKAFDLSHESIKLSMAGEHNWEKLVGKKNKFIMYGYGKNGKKLLDWLLYFNIPILEIWDKSAEKEQEIAGIPMKKMHNGYLKRGIIILCTIQLPEIYYPIFCELRMIGYCSIISYAAIESAIRYQTYKQFIPFLFEQFLSGSQL